MTSGASAANSAACLRIVAALLVAQPVSMRMFWPMLHPDCCKPCRNAPNHDWNSASSAVVARIIPMRRIRSGCWARSCSGHPATKPATTLMNSRLRTIAPQRLNVKSLALWTERRMGKDDIQNHLRSRSIRLEIDGFNHASPFDDVGPKHRVGRFLIKVERLKAELFETGGHFRIFQNLVDRHIQGFGDFVRRFRRQEKSGPRRCDETGVPILAVSRNVGQNGHALLAGYR